jgi:hypothetical protein
MVRSVNPKREKKELGYFCIFLHLVFGRVFLPQLQLCTNLSKNRKIKQHCQVTLMRAFTHFIPTIKPTNERNSFRYVFSRVSNVSETNFRHAPAKSLLERLRKPEMGCYKLWRIFHHYKVYCNSL